MSRGMVFRKDCEDCGRSFFTPDRKTDLCPRCAARGLKSDQRVRTSTEKRQLMTLAASKVPIKPRPPLTPTEALKPQGSREYETHEDQNELPGAQRPGMARTEIVLTKDQEQEIIRRYQAYVQGMERPSKGRRRTIAAEMELPYRAVVLAVRGWNQSQSQGKDLSREERFWVEKSYFSLLERESSFSRVQEQITQETGLCQWQVCRYLDLLHDGEDRLRQVPDVSPEQRMAILAEYYAYLSAPAPPHPPLHALIAERTGVNPKQVHKVLLAYRLGRFRENLM